MFQILTPEVFLVLPLPPTWWRHLLKANLILLCPWITILLDQSLSISRNWRSFFFSVQYCTILNLNLGFRFTFYGIQIRQLQSKLLHGRRFSQLNNLSFFLSVLISSYHILQYYDSHKIDNFLFESWVKSRKLCSSPPFLDLVKF